MADLDALKQAMDDAVTAYNTALQSRQVAERNAVTRAEEIADLVQQRIDGEPVDLDAAVAELKTAIADLDKP